MPVVTSEEHKQAAQRLKEIYATYQDAEDLINIGAFVPGSNKRIDAAVALIEPLRAFLTQPVRERTAFDETVGQLTAIHGAWQQMVHPQAAAAAAR